MCWKEERKKVGKKASGHGGGTLDVIFRVLVFGPFSLPLSLLLFLLLALHLSESTIYRKYMLL